MFVWLMSSGIDAVVTCQSAIESAERQLFHSRNANNRPEAVVAGLGKRTFRNDKGQRQADSEAGRLSAGQDG